MKKLALALAVLALSACATSGPVELADGTFSITSANTGGLIGGGAAGAERRALEAAAEVCAKQGKKPYLVDGRSKQESGAFAFNNAAINGQYRSQYNGWNGSAQGNINGHSSGFAGTTIGAGTASLQFGCR